MVRGALVALLGFEPDIEVVAEVASGDDILPVPNRVDAIRIAREAEWF